MGTTKDSWEEKAREREEREQKDLDLRIEVLTIQAANLRHFEAGRVQRERDEERERMLRTEYFERQAELNSIKAKREVLRDHLAMSAMNSLLIAKAPPTWSDPSWLMELKNLSARSWEAADAMLEARGK